MGLLQFMELSNHFYFKLDVIPQESLNIEKVRHLIHVIHQIMWYLGLLNVSRLRFRMSFMIIQFLV